MPAEPTHATGAPVVRRATAWLPLAVVAFAVVAGPLLGARTTQAGPSDEILREGAAAYTAVCSSCHQAGGVGLAGKYPPLLDNPNVQDAAYVEDVIRNGRTGPITVNGETYDGVMPAQGAALTDPQITALIAYVQSGFQAPAGPAPAVDTGPVAGTELPLLSTYAYIAAFLVAAGLAALVLGPRVIAAHDRREVTWVDAWMKTAVIVVGAIVVTTIVPARVLELETVQDLPRTAQDLIAVGLWTGGLAALLLALWYAHRERRV
jgi:mono/diheme cytochrome c family protein